MILLVNGELYMSERVNEMMQCFPVMTPRNPSHDSQSRKINNGIDFRFFEEKIIR